MKLVDEFPNGSVGPIYAPRLDIPQCFNRLVIPIRFGYITGHRFMYLLGRGT